MEPPKKTSGGAAEKDAPEKDDGEEKGKAPLDILEEAPRPPKRAYQVTKHRGLQSSTEFTGVGATTTAWNDIHLPTVKEFRAQSSVFLAKRGDGLKSIEGALTAFHAAKEKGGVEKMEDRVVLYGALRQLAAACQAYMDSDPFFKKRKPVATSISIPTRIARSSGAIPGLCKGHISSASGGRPPKVQKTPGNSCK